MGKMSSEKTPESISDWLNSKYQYKLAFVSGHLLVRIYKHLHLFKCLYSKQL